MHKYLSIKSSDYPNLLKEIYQPPYKLYYKGANIRTISRKGVLVAIVGTRLPSGYGKQMAYDITRAVTENGGIVVSGLAFGIDAICHQAAIDLQKPTIAVLASGIKSITPSSHTKLAEEIIKTGGTIVSENSDTERSMKYQYVKRNRIISGLCKSTVVIEAKERSGALITARHAFEQDREVYALVGDVNRPQARGCLSLIAADKAHPITSIDKLLEDLGLRTRESIMGNLSIAAVSILKLIQVSPMHLYNLIDNSSLPSPEVNCAISELEIAGLIKQSASGKWEFKST